LSRLVQVAVVSHTPVGGEPGLPRRREPDLAGLATFTLDTKGRITSWSVTAARLFGPAAQAVTGQDVCDVLLTGPGHRELVDRALAETAAGQVHTATVAGGSLGEGRFAVRWEPLGGLGGGAVVIAQRAWPQPAPSWLREAAARIGSSLDLVETATEVAEAAVPGFADVAIVYVAERLAADDELTSASVAQGAAVRRLAGRQAVQSADAAEQLSQPSEVLVLGPDTSGARAMATGAPVLLDHIDSATARRLARYPHIAESSAAYTAFLAVPLIARGVVVGCAVFGRMQASPPFNQGDVTMAGELASRAAVCLDNARLYDRERRTAQALQQGLRPGRTRVPDGLEVAHRYRPVGDNVVGGDWHDIVSLPGGRAALIVGDAMGHGPEAAAVMVQLRTAAHTLADLDLPPELMLRKLDAMAAGLSVAPFVATCVYAIIDPASRSCVIAQAGHQPPVLVLADGTTRVLNLPPGLPLGLGEECFEATPLNLPPGSILALYTDGLVEGRTRTLDTGLAELRDSLGRALSDPAASLRVACRSVTEMPPEDVEDDITLVLARIRPRRASGLPRASTGRVRGPRASAPGSGGSVQAPGRPG
jgi:serine phosphatase RsbU (regulator of sigma subunit)